MKIEKTTRSASQIATRDATEATKKTKKKKELTALEIDRTGTVPLKSILVSESRNLKQVLPFHFDKKQKDEDPIDFCIGSFPLDTHVRMYADITTKQHHLGMLFRIDGDMVFEATHVKKGAKLLFSREGFNEAVKDAASELDEYIDIGFSDSSSESGSEELTSSVERLTVKAEHANGPEKEKNLEHASSSSSSGSNTGDSASTADSSPMKIEHPYGHDNAKKTE